LSALTAASSASLFSFSSYSSSYFIFVPSSFFAIASESCLSASILSDSSFSAINLASSASYCSFLALIAASTASLSNLNLSF